MRSSAGPLRDVAIEFGVGVTALYGLNGAGKSWILQALRSCFTGVALPNTHLGAGRLADPRHSHPGVADTHLIVELPPAPQTGSERLDGPDQGSSWLYSLLAAVEEMGVRADGPALEILVRDWFARGGRHFRPSAEELSRVPSTWLKELVSSRFLALVPTGAATPQWDVWLCAAPDPAESPNVHRLADLARRLEGGLAPLARAIGEFDDALRDGHVDVLVRESVRTCAKQLFDDLATIGRHDEYLEALLQMCDAEIPEVDYSDFMDWVSDVSRNWLSLPTAAWAWDRPWIVDDGGTHHEDSGDRFRSMLSDGLPLPMARIAENVDHPFVLEDELSATDIDVLTARLFAEVLAEETEWGTDSIELTPGLKRWVEQLEAQANTTLGALVPDPPQFELRLAPPYEWVLGPATRWVVERALPLWAPDGRRMLPHASLPIPIADLSTAERRWARVAIRRALDAASAMNERVVERRGLGSWPPRLSDDWPHYSDRYRRSDVILIDEPESALHRAAEAHMASGLDGLSVAGPQIVVATHSPEILNRPEATLIHVRRGHNGATETSQVKDLNLEESLPELGLRPSDLLGMYRVFLLVEGEHDDTVVRTFLADVLEQARVKVIPMRGGARLPSTIESHLLFDMTTAHVFAMLDNVASAVIDTAWREAQERYLTADASEAIDHLTTTLRDHRGDEYNWISTWLSRALKKGVNKRLVPFGLEAADIIEYLPVEVIAPGAVGKTWSELRAEHEAAKPNLNRAKNDFKTWLNRSYQGDTRPSNIQRAAQAVTEVPDEFIKLGYRLREVSSRRV